MYWNNQDIKTLEQEQWETVENYEGVYEVSNFGRVKRLVGYACWTERVLKQCIAGRYCRVTLSKNSINYAKGVHILVAQTFIPNPNNYPLVLHEDDNPCNNSVSNLRWGTQKQNIQDCHKRGRAHNNLPKMSGINHPSFCQKMSNEIRKRVSDSRKRITDEQILIAKDIVSNNGTLIEASKKTGISVAYLSQLLNGGYKRL